MKIDRIETFLVPPRWLFLKVTTDSGIVGWGEPVVEGRARTVATAIEEMSDLLIGQDPLRIEDLWQTMTRTTFYRGGPVFASAVAGVDQALWDIAGKHRNAPVHELLGGPVRDRLRVYAWIGGDKPGAITEHAQLRRAQGYTAVKMNLAGPTTPIDSFQNVNTICRRVETARDAMGDENDVALDFHGRLTVAMAKRVLRELEPLQPFFVEEPVRPEFTAQLASVTASTTIPIATGERLYSRWDFAPALASGIAIAQPDISHAGGISEVRRIASCAEVYDVHLAPHCPLGPIAFAASVQAALAIPNFLIHEYGFDMHYNIGTEYLDYLLDIEPFKMVNGFIARPTGPGLGIEVDELAVRTAAKTGHEWKTPIWRLPDGSLTEW